MKRENNLIVILLFAIFFLGVVEGKITVGNASNKIESIYGPEDTLKGWINISIEGENGGLELKDSKENSIKFLDLLRMNEVQGESNFVCEMANCSDKYSSDGVFSENEFNLTKGEEKTFGVSFTGQGVEIEDVYFEIESDAAPSCNSQIEIVFGDLNIFTLKNPKPSSNDCKSSRSYGCFNVREEQTQEFRLVDNQEYCQKIDVRSAPSVIAGAWIRKESGNENVTFSIKTANYEEIPGATCTLHSSNLDSSGKEVGCKIDYAIEEPKDVILCVKKSTGPGYVYIKGYPSEKNPCGFYTGSGSYPTSAYRLFINGLEYATPGKINISEKETKSSINLAFNEYLSKNYKNADCSSGCIIPITFIGKTDQRVKISGLNVEYRTAGGPLSPKKEFSKVKKVPSKFSTRGFVKLNIDLANFRVPKGIKKHELTFYIGREELLKKEIEIQSVPIINAVTPTIAFSANPTTFKVGVTTFNSTISRYVWKFVNENISKTTTYENVTHTFNSTGKHLLEVEVVDSRGRSSKKTFEITVEKPEVIIGIEYNKTKSRQEFLNSQIKVYPTWIKERISELLGLKSVSSELESILRLNASAGDDIGKKNLVLSKLLNISLPSSVFVSSKVNSSFVPSKEVINLDIIKEVASGSYETSKTSEYKEYIVANQLNNVEAIVDSKSISANYDEGVRHILGSYAIKFSRKGGEDTQYIFIKKMGGLKFDSSMKASAASSGDYYYFRLDSGSIDVSFTTTENINFMQLPIFVSSSLAYIDLSDVPLPEGEGPTYGKINWWLLIISLLILGIIALVVYLFLQSWYKYRYEDYLFKGRNNMFNLIIFIEAQKKMNASDSEIFKKLRRAGWSREQINYVIRKYLGKRTGMIEIPIKNPFDPPSPTKENPRFARIPPSVDSRSNAHLQNRNVRENRVGSSPAKKGDPKDKNTKFNKP